MNTVRSSMLCAVFFFLGIAKKRRIGYNINMKFFSERARYGEFCFGRKIEAYR